MNINITSIVFLVLISLTMGCRKDYERNGRETGKNDPPVFVNCSITGIVKDQNGQPLNFVEIVQDSTTILTDDNGFFYLKDIQANSKGELIVASLSGYNTNSTIVYPKLNEISFVQITLNQGMFTNGTNGLVGGTVNYPNGSELIIKEKSTFDLTGNLYNGDININCHQLDPLEGLFSENILSAQIGLDLLLNKKVLQSFSAFNVLAIDDKKQLVNFDPNNQALFKSKIPDNMLSYAPDKILLWQFDNTISKWKNSGEASKVDGYYQAFISESGWYNLAIGHEPVQMQSTFVDDQSRPIAYSTITVEGETNNFYLNMKTSNNGFIQAFLPTNDRYNLTLKNCADEVIQTYISDNISSDKDLGAIDFSGKGNLRQVEAILTNCDDRPVERGYIKFNSDPITIIPVENNGIINSTLFICQTSDEIVYNGIDWDNKIKGDRLVRVVEPLMEMGDVFACPNTDSSYLNIFQDSIHVVSAISATISLTQLKQQTVFAINGIFEKPNDQFEFSLYLEEDYTEKTRNAIDLNYVNSIDDLSLGIELDNIVNDSINVIIKRKAYKKGDLIKGSFDCEYIDNNLKKHLLTGSFRATFE